VRGGQEWGLRHRNVGLGGEQVRKGEGLAVDGQQHWEMKQRQKSTKQHFITVLITK